MAEIELVRLSKEYGDGHEAVSSVDLRIPDGEIMILVGPSGCGKSTILRMIAGLEEATSGEVKIDGRVVNDLQPRDRDIAMVFQNYALYPHMTVRDNLAYPLRMAKTSANERRSRVEQAAELLDLGEHLDRKPAQLSGGQRQRVAMGRAIVRDPKAFLMDEPLSNLDAKLRVQMRTQIALLQDRLGTTMVYVTHDQTEAMTLGDRVAVMRDGLLQQVGTPLELYNEPANLFVAGFIGAPGMNLMPGALDAGHLELPLGRVGAPAFRATGDREIVAGVRPEDFQLLATPGATEATVSIRASVDLLEATGSELYAHLGLGPRSSHNGTVVAEADERLVARLDARVSVQQGDAIEVTVDPCLIHVFDAASGERLGLAADGNSSSRSPDPEWATTG